MSDFTSNFWHFYVAGLTLASILACALLLYKLGKMKVAPAPNFFSSSTNRGTPSRVPRNVSTSIFSANFIDV